MSTPRTIAEAAAAGAPAEGAATGIQIGYAITRLHHALRRALDDKLRELGLNTAQYVVLRELGGEPALSAAELARRASVRPQAMAPIITELEDRGLLERSPHPRNRRVLEVDLTSAGRRVLAECVARYAAVEEQLLNGIGAAQRASFQRVLQACLANMDPPWYHGGTPGGLESETRAKLLRSARTLFLERGLEGTELRHIAADAGVDVSLIRRYFGSKQRLFTEATQAGQEQPVVAGRETGRAWLARVLMAQGFEDIPPLALLRSQTTPEASRQLTQELDRDLIRPLAARIDAGDPELRAEMIAALLLGIGLLRLLTDTSPLARAEEADITELFDRAVSALTARS